MNITTLKFKKCVLNVKKNVDIKRDQRKFKRHQLLFQRLPRKDIN